MVYERSLLVFFCIVFAIGVQLTRAQHWSYGWYPGGKREIALPGNLEDSEDIKLCDGQGCPYMKVTSDKVVKHLLVSSWILPLEILDHVKSLQQSNPAHK
uniref:Progonadoliberin n=1 Tax=Naja naja TaxID=35670 RepID=A0A8C6Y167_NAJNA